MLINLNYKLIIFYLLLISSIFSIDDINFYKQEYKFAQNLIKEGEYDRAITSLKRLNSFYPKNSNIINNLSLISDCYYLNQNYIESNNVSSSILDMNKTHWPSIVKSIKSFQNLDYYYESNNFIEKYKSNFESNKLDTLKLFTTINHIHLYEVDAAKNILKNIDSNSLVYEQKIKFIELINNEYPLKLKNKKIATLYSILPGGGYIYTDHYETAFSAFLVNILFYKATYDAYNTGNHGVGYFCSFLSLSFYFGSMTGSWQLVDKYNKKLKRAFANHFILD